MTDEKNNEDTPENNPDTEATSLNRRELLLGAGGAAATAGLAATGIASNANAMGVTVATPTPVYYPRPNFTPEINLSGKTAVITGASRGIGRATGEALAALGVNVIGTSRDAANVPNPPTAFPLVDLDVVSDASVASFVSTVSGLLGTNTIDILINNAGRYVGGQIVNPGLGPDPDQFFIDQIKLGMETNYHGQIRVTNKLLPLMTPTGYARLLYTVSIAGYLVGGGATGSALGLDSLHAYYSTKTALRTYVNYLRGKLGVTGSNVKVSSVNPFIIDTPLPLGNNPIWTEPVDANGDPLDPASLAGAQLLRASQAGGLPASYVADTFVQLLQSNEPRENVVVGAPFEPDATSGGNPIILNSLKEEEEQSAVRYLSGIPGC